MTPLERAEKIVDAYPTLSGPRALAEMIRATIVEVTNEEIARQQQLFSEQVEEISNLSARIVELEKELIAARRGSAC